MPPLGSWLSYVALQLADRIGENVVVTETRVRIPLTMVVLPW
jgi:hypothetical protein